MAPSAIQLLRIEARKKAMSIVLSVASSGNVEEVVLFLKKQLQRMQEQDYEKAPECRQLLIQTIHVMAVNEVVEKFPHLHPGICGKLIQTLSEIKFGKVHRGVLWILGEYVEDIADITVALQEIRRVLGEIPIFASEQRLLDEAGGEAEGEDKDKVEAKAEGSGGRRPRVLAAKAASKPPLRALILGGDFFTGAVLTSTLMKLVLRFDELTSERAKANAVRAEAMLIMTSTIRIGQSKFVTKKAVEKREAEGTQVAAAQVDDPLTFRQFSKKPADDPIDYVEDLGKATGAGEVCEDFISNLSRISQLTSFSDPIYAEAYVKARGFDILLDVLLVNQAPNTLQNLCLDFATLGDRKLVERPA
ncbi:hypothetical protein BV22DRAFT_1135201, partial [Leucogyrophana mollusca]